MGIFTISDQGYKKTLTLQSPADLRVVGNYDCASHEDIKSTMAKSRMAQKAWSKISLENRVELMHRVIDVIIENQDHIMNVVMEETGKPIQEAMSMEIFSAIDSLAFYAKRAPKWLRDEKRSMHGPMSFLKKTKVILTVHVLGNSTNMGELKKIVDKNNLILIEDTCESLGSRYNNKYLGTFGKFGTYSFYISHQITSGEGGMIVCNNKDDYNLVFKLRAHGWDRGLNKNPTNTFNFINSGFNLRPMDLTAAIGFNQFKRLNKMKKIRSDNRLKIIARSKSHADVIENFSNKEVAGIVEDWNSEQLLELVTE